MKRLLSTAGLLLVLATLWSMAGCKKDYFVDGGLAEAHFDGSIYAYLEAKPYWFDTVTYIIERAGMKNRMETGEITFFSPTDDAVKVVMDDLNAYRYTNVEDSVHLEDIDPVVWRYFLSMYILQGKFMAKDFARVDPTHSTAYPGIDYITSEGFVVNIGLLYNDYKGVKSVGARIIRLTDITEDPDHFQNNPAVTVMSSDIQPTNGILHVLNNNNVLGFQSGRFVQMAEQYLLLSGK